MADDDLLQQDSWVDVGAGWPGTATGETAVSAALAEAGVKKRGRGSLDEERANTNASIMQTVA